MKKVLIKDLIIPAGTIFNDAPAKTEIMDNGFVETIIGLTPDSYGIVRYSFDDSANEQEKDKLRKYFVDVIE